MYMYMHTYNHAYLAALASVFLKSVPELGTISNHTYSSLGGWGGGVVDV